MRRNLARKDRFLKCGAHFFECSNTDVLHMFVHLHGCKREEYNPGLADWNIWFARLCWRVGRAAGRREIWPFAARTRWDTPGRERKRKTEAIAAVVPCKCSSSWLKTSVSCLHEMCVEMIWCLRRRHLIRTAVGEIWSPESFSAAFYLYLSLEVDSQSALLSTLDHNFNSF